MLSAAAIFRFVISRFVRCDGTAPIPISSTGLKSGGHFRCGSATTDVIPKNEEVSPVIFFQLPLLGRNRPLLFFRGISLETLMESAFSDDSSHFGANFAIFRCILPCYSKDGERLRRVQKRRRGKAAEMAAVAGAGSLPRTFEGTPQCFPDRAVAQGCVTCHNEHPNTTKGDWKLNDMMGATTWSYPKDKVTMEEALQLVTALRTSFAAAYDGYLAKAATYEKPPEVGERWPRDGYFVPGRRSAAAITR